MLNAQLIKDDLKLRYAHLKSAINILALNNYYWLMLKIE